MAAPLRGRHLGQRKAATTLIDGASQIVVEKQTVDVFQSPKLVSVVENLQPDHCVVYGVASTSSRS